MNPKLAKLATKAGISIVFATAIGYAIKLEHKLEDRIDARYSDENTDD